MAPSDTADDQAIETSNSDNTTGWWGPDCDLDDGVVQLRDSLIHQWLANEQESHVLSEGIDETVVEGVQEQENPLADPLAVSLSGVPGFASAAAVKLLSERLQVLKLNGKSQSMKAYRPSRNLKLVSEVALNGWGERVSEKVEYSDAGSFFMGSESCFVCPAIKTLPPPEPKPRDYLQLTITDFHIHDDPIAPVFGTSALYCDNEYISEEWTFATDFTEVMYSELDHPIKIARNNTVVIELPRTSKPVAMIFVLSQLLTVDAGEPIKDYYLDSSRENSGR